MQRRESVDQSSTMGLLEALKTIARGGRSLFELEPSSVANARETVANATEFLDGTPIIEQRTADESELEFVFRSKHLTDVVTALERAFGPAAKPHNVNVAFQRDVRQLIETRGGIRREQTLFLARAADGTVAFAALWPWNGDKYTTLKVGVYAEQLAPSS